jgi:hypothetical protein
MLTSSLDASAAILVCRYTTPYEAADYVGYHAEFARLLAAARSGKRRAVLIIDIQDGYPQPNALQRKDIGDAWAKAHDIDAAIAVLTSSALIRGIITAIEWFSKNSTNRRETRALARASDAVSWLHEYSGIDAARFDALLDTVRNGSRHIARAHA